MAKVCCEREFSLLWFPSPVEAEGSELGSSDIPYFFVYGAEKKGEHEQRKKLRGWSFSSADEAESVASADGLIAPNISSSASLDDLQVEYPNNTFIRSLSSRPDTLSSNIFDNMITNLLQKQSELRKRPSLLRKTLSAAVNKIKERQQYNQVTRQTMHGDGLKSIFADYSVLGNFSNSKKGSISQFSPSKIPRNLSSFSEPSEVYLALRSHSLFSWMPEPVLRSFSKLLAPEEYSKGIVLCKTGEQLPNTAFLILSGSVNLSFEKIEIAANQVESQIQNLRSPKGRSNISKKKKFRKLLQTEMCDFVLRQGGGGSCLLDVLAIITKCRIASTCTMTVAEEGTNLLKITLKSFEELFDMFQGVKEELIQRILIQLQRVTFLTIHSLTGYYILEYPDISDIAEPKSMPEMSASSFLENEAYRLLSKELGVTSAELSSTLDLQDWRYVNAADIEPNEDSLQSEEYDSDIVAHIVEIDAGTDIMDISDQPAMYVVLSGKLEVYSIGAEVSSNISGNYDAQGEDDIDDATSEASVFSVECLNDLDVNNNLVEYEVVPGQSLGHFTLLTNSWNDVYVRRGSSNAKLDSLFVVSGYGNTANEENETSRVANDSQIHSSTTLLIRLSEDNYFRLLDRFPKILQHQAAKLLTESSLLVRMIDSTIRVTNPKAGDTILREGQITDSVQVVLHGRFLGMKRPNESSGLSSLVADSLHFANTATGEHIVNKLQRGATIGLTNFPLLNFHKSHLTVKALRDGQVASVPRSILQAVVNVQPEALLHLGLTLGRSVQTYMLRRQGIIADSTVSKVVTIIPASPQANIESFTYTLAEALESIDVSVQILVSSLLERISTFQNPYNQTSKFSMYTPSTLEETMLTSILNQVEDTNEIVLMLVDPWVNSVGEPTWWSSYAVRQADLILYVGNALDKYSQTVLEERISHVRTNARKELVLLYFENPNSNHVDEEFSAGAFPEPRGTRKWIQSRGGIHFHHHIRCNPNRKRFDIEHYKSDFRRLARWLLGRSVGVVLGGGGARGCSHLSVVRALENEGIPIDFIAGSSIGAFMGGLYAWKTDNLYMIPVVAKFSAEMSSTWKKIRDLTFPITSYFTGLAFNRSIVKLFQGKKIEDLWLPFFCMSTDLTDSKAIPHRNGALWRYVRASMTLVNFMPPICDVIMDDDNPNSKRVHYLADGGYMNNLPVDIMREMIGPKGTIIAADVQSDWTFAGDDYGDYLNGWWYLYKWLNPWGKTPKIPTSSDIQTQLAYISSVQQGGTSNSKMIVEGKFQAESLKGHIDLFLHPPVENFGTLEFNQNKAIQLIGFEYAQKKIKSWVEELKEKDQDRVKYFLSKPLGAYNKQKFTSKPQKRRKLNRRSLSWAKLNMGL